MDKVGNGLRAFGQMFIDLGDKADDPEVQKVVLGQIDTVARYAS